MLFPPGPDTGCNSRICALLTLKYCRSAPHRSSLAMWNSIQYCAWKTSTWAYGPGRKGHTKGAPGRQCSRLSLTLCPQAVTIHVSRCLLLAYLFLLLAVAVRVLAGPGTFAPHGFTPRGPSLL